MAGVRDAGAHVIVLPGGGYAMHAPHEGQPIADWLNWFGVEASVFAYPLNVQHPAPLDALRKEILRLRSAGSARIGVIGCSAGGHLAGLAALTDSGSGAAVDFAVLCYAITSMETETYRPARVILLGEDATPELRRSTSLNALVTPSSPPFFLWHTAEDAYVPPQHTYLLAASLAAVALLAATLSISSLASLSVLERRQEIGLMKAIGAQDWLIGSLFLAETALQGVLGGSLGFAGGQFLAQLLGRVLFGSGVALNWLILPLVLAIALGVSSIGTWVAVRRAARQDPARVLQGV